MSPDSSTIVFKDIGSMSQEAAELFAQNAEIALKERGRVLVALSGGRTPEQLFQLLSKPPYALSIPWEQTHFFWCDERLVPPNHPESNFGQAFRFLFSKVKIPGGNLHRIRGEIDPDQAVEAYREILKSFSDGQQKWPRFDLAFLGLGADGHTASLFPGTINSEEKASPVLAVTADYQERPAWRVTLTPLVFNSARNVIFMVSGKDKAYAVNMTRNGPPEPVRWPAQRIKPVEGKITWLLDDNAASH
ncbi:MAG: 6-phosphogluconolactonase [Anaerolineales bacterium]|nr:6-phosphogluconolactonase [Anaerolineales bacterium]